MARNGGSGRPTSQFWGAASGLRCWKVPGGAVVCSPRLGTRACPFPARAQRNQPGALGVREARGLGAWGPGRPLLVGLGRGGAGAKGAPPLGARTQHPAARALEPRACPALGVPLWAPLRAALGGGVNTSSPSADAWTRRSPVPLCVSGAHALLRGPGARSGRCAPGAGLDRGSRRLLHLSRFHPYIPALRMLERELLPSPGVRAPPGPSGAF